MARGQLPGHSPAFLRGDSLHGDVVATRAKNAAAYLSQILAADLKKRISINLRMRCSAACTPPTWRCEKIARPAGDRERVFWSNRTDGGWPRRPGLHAATTSIACFYLGALFYISWSLTLLVLALAVAIGSTLTFVYRRITTAGVELTDLNHRIAAVLTQSFAGVRIVRATNSQARVIDEFHALSTAQAQAEERSTHASSLLCPSPRRSRSSAPC